MSTSFMVGAAMALSALGLVGLSAPGAATADVAVGGCGNAFDLRYGPDFEAMLEAQIDHTNGDGFVCVLAVGKPGGYFVILDNPVRLR